MDWNAFQSWLLPAVLGALCWVAWDARQRLEAKHDEQGRAITGSIEAMRGSVQEIRDMMRTELRALDVRIARIEAHIWPHQPRQ
jgi:hypothetical protein